jgi:hypothetical protein
VLTLVAVCLAGVLTGCDDGKRSLTGQVTEVDQSNSAHLCVRTSAGQPDVCLQASVAKLVSVAVTDCVTVRYHQSNGGEGMFNGGLEALDRASGC